MTRQLKNKIGYKLNDKVSKLLKEGKRKTLILQSGMTIQYDSVDENRIEWLIDRINNVN